jgi:hypothetical protein
MSASRPCSFNPEERVTGTHWIENSVGPRAGVDAVEYRKSLSLEENRTSAFQPVSRPYTDWAIIHILRYIISKVDGASFNAQIIIIITIIM